MFIKGIMLLAVVAFAASSALFIHLQAEAGAGERERVSVGGEAPVASRPAAGHVADGELSLSAREVDSAVVSDDEGDDGYAGYREEDGEKVQPRYDAGANTPAPPAAPGSLPVLGSKYVAPQLERAEAVRSAFLWAFNEYRASAWGSDEISPLTGEPRTEFGGMGATLVDSLDTLWLMGLREEFDEAAEWIFSSFSADKNWNGSVFEVTIRYVGGFLAAYDLTGNEGFIDAAVRVAERLLPAFQCEGGLAKTTVNLASGHVSNPSWNGGQCVLSEFGSLLLEWRTLSRVSGDDRFRAHVDAIYYTMSNVTEDRQSALLPAYWDCRTGKPSNQHVTFGAWGDSYFEYLVKQWHLSGGRDERARELFGQVVTEIRERMIQSTPDGRYTYIAEMRNGVAQPKVDELTCFLGGSLTMTGRPEDLELADRLGRTCYAFFAKSKTGLAGEIYKFRTGANMFEWQASHNLLRPETVETLFYLTRATADDDYRDMSWDIFLAFNRSSRVAHGFSGVRDVNKVPPVHDNRQESFFFAETLKYLYLTFAGSEAFDMSAYVLNTEAHPLAVHGGRADRTGRPSDSTFPAVRGDGGRPADGAALEAVLLSA